MKSLRCLLFILGASCVQSTIYTDLANFCKNNGFKFISLSTENDQIIMEKKEAFKALEKSGLRVKTLSNLDDLDFNMDTFILLAKKDILQDENAFQTYLELMGAHRIRKSVFVMTQPLNPDEFQALDSLLQTLLRVNAHFYLIFSDLEGDA